MLLTKLNSFKQIKVPVYDNIDWDKVISKPQKKVKDFLHRYWEYDPVCEEFYIPGSKFRIDLFNIRLKIAVEISPDGYHVQFNSHLHKDRFGFLKKVKSDEQKREWCNRNGIRLIELYDDDIKKLSHEYINEKYGVYL